MNESEENIMQWK